MENHPLMGNQWTRRVAPTQIGHWTPMLRSVEAALGFPTDRGWWDFMGCHEIFQYGQGFQQIMLPKKPTMMAIRDAIIYLEYIQKKFFCPSDVHVGSILKGCRKKYHRYPWKAEGKNISTCLWLGSIQHVVYIYKEMCTWLVSSNHPPKYGSKIGYMSNHLPVYI